MKNLRIYWVRTEKIKIHVLFILTHSGLIWCQQTVVEGLKCTFCWVCLSCVYISLGKPWIYLFGFKRSIRRNHFFLMSYTFWCLFECKNLFFKTRKCWTSCVINVIKCFQFSRERLEGIECLWYILQTLMQTHWLVSVLCVWNRWVALIFFYRDTNWLENSKKHKNNSSYDVAADENCSSWFMQDRSVMISSLLPLVMTSLLMCLQETDNRLLPLCKYSACVTHSLEPRRHLKYSTGSRDLEENLFWVRGGEKVELSCLLHVKCFTVQTEDRK